MTKEYFPGIGAIKFEGAESKNPLAFHYYDANRVVMGKPMKEWFKFAMAWWHTLGQASADPFGGQTRSYAWDQPACPYERARAKADAGFEFMQKLGIGYFCFHDIDLVEDCEDIAEYETRMKDNEANLRRAAESVEAAEYGLFERGLDAAGEGTADLGSTAGFEEVGTVGGEA